MFRWSLEGASTRRIVRRLNKVNIRTEKGRVWNPPTVRRILGNQAHGGIQHSGVNRYRRVRHQKGFGTPRPGSERMRIDDFSSQKSARSSSSRYRSALRRSYAGTGPGRHYMLARFPECLICGSTFVGTSLQKGLCRYCRCCDAVPASLRSGTRVAPYIRADELEEVAWRMLAEAICGPVVLIAGLLGHLPTVGGDLGE